MTRLWFDMVDGDEFDHAIDNTLERIALAFEPEHEVQLVTVYPARAPLGDGDPLDTTLA